MEAKRKSTTRSPARGDTTEKTEKQQQHNTPPTEAPCGAIPCRMHAKKRVPHQKRIRRSSMPHNSRKTQKEIVFNREHGEEQEQGQQGRNRFGKEVQARCFGQLGGLSAFTIFISIFFRHCIIPIIPPTANQWHCHYGIQLISYSAWIEGEGSCLYAFSYFSHSDFRFKGIIPSGIGVWVGFWVWVLGSGFWIPLPLRGH